PARVQQGGRRGVVRGVEREEPGERAGGGRRQDAEAEGGDQGSAADHLDRPLQHLQHAARCVLAGSNASARSNGRKAPSNGRGGVTVQGSLKPTRSAVPTSRPAPRQRQPVLGDSTQPRSISLMKNVKLAAVAA